jgi:hypothetical protein
MDIAKAWEDLLLDPRLPDALDIGATAVVGLLAAASDSALQNAFPVYAAAVSVCLQAENANIFDCDAQRRKVRDRIMWELADKSGLLKVIEAVVTAWQIVPPELRRVYGKAIRAVQTIAASDIGKLARYATSDTVGPVISGFAGSASEVGNVVKSMWDGEIELPALQDAFFTLTSLNTDNVKKVLHSAGANYLESQLSPIVAGLSAVGLSDEAAAIASVAKKAEHAIESTFDSVIDFGASLAGGAWKVVGDIFDYLF